MAKKDPAFLFYPKDFLTGCSDLTMEERGQYITMLCIQHQKGHISSKWLSINLPNASSDVLSKFVPNEEGNLINIRLDVEIEKRSKHTPKKIAAAVLGGLISANKLKTKDAKKIREQFKIDDFVDLDKDLMKQKISEWFKHMLNLLVNGDVNVNEDVNGDKEKKEREKYFLDNPKVQFPFDSENFMKNWRVWVDYRIESRKKLKSAIGAQGQLMKLSELSNGNEEIAIQIIKQSIQNNWAGFFELKTQTNGQSTETATERAERFIKYRQAKQ